MQKAGASSQPHADGEVHQHETLAEARLASGCYDQPPSGSSGEKERRSRLGGSSLDEEGKRQPVEELQMIAASLASEINDKHLIILDIVGRGGFGTVSGRSGSRVLGGVPEP